MPPESGITEGKFAFKSGKLLKVRARFEEDKILFIQITGDFFIYPENAIEKLEERLKDKKIGEVEKVVGDVLRDCEYIGVTPEDIIRAVKMAWMKRK